jgi:hypothetical protein
MHWSRFLAVFSCAFVASGVGAEGTEAHGRWLVLPATVVGPESADVLSADELREAVESLRQELAARGRDVWRGERAGERFEVVGSAPAPDVSQSDIDRWVARSNAAVRYLARADYKAARRELRAAQRLADRAAEELNREAARAQQVLDTCLFMVRAYLETDDDEEARRQARECRHLVPRVEPTAYRHTPEVRELLAEVDAVIAAEAPGSLSVESTPAGCAARVNGVELGRTPLRGVELPLGTYRLQVECVEGERGRIHRMRVESGDNVFAFDAALDRAVRTRPTLLLQYGSVEALDERMPHAASVASSLEASGVVVVSAAGPSSARLDSSAAGYTSASIWVPLSNGSLETDEARRAVDALLGGRSVDFTGTHPISRESWARAATGAGASVASVEAGGEQAKMASTARPREQRIAGWTLFGAGVASIGASVGLHVWRGDLGERFVEMPSSLSEAQRWNDARIAVWTTAAFGGAATTAAMPLLLPNRARTPWWGWTLGAAGLGLTGYAIYEGVTMTACPEPFVANDEAVRACVARGQQAGRIALALAGAAPLLTVPIVYLFRPLRAEPSLSVSGAGALVRVRKAF